MTSSENNMLRGIGKKYPGVARVHYFRVVTFICFIWMADSTNQNLKYKPNNGYQISNEWEQYCNMSKS